MKTSAPAEAQNARCEPNTCTDRAFYLPSFSKPNELKDVVNAFRIILDTSRVSLDQSQRTVSLQGTPEQLAIAEKLVTVLVNLRNSEGHDRSSVLISEPLPEKTSVQPSEGDPERCELTNCFVNIFYLPDLTIGQLQDAVNNLHFVVQIKRICIVPSSHAIVFQSNSKQLALAKELVSHNQLAGEAPSEF